MIAFRKLRILRKLENQSIGESDSQNVCETGSSAVTNFAVVILGIRQRAETPVRQWRTGQVPPQRDRAIGGARMTDSTKLLPSFQVFRTISLNVQLLMLEKIYLNII